MKRIHLLGVVVLLIVGFFIWWFTPTQVVKRRTSNLLEALTFSEGSGMASRQVQGYTFTSYIGETLELNTPSVPEANGRFSRDMIELGYQSLSRQARESGFDVVHFDSVFVDGDTAVVHATIDGFVQLQNFRPVDGRHEVELHWQRSQDGWRLQRASWQESR